MSAESNITPSVEISAEKMDRLRKLASNHTFLSDFGGFVALEQINSASGINEAAAEDRIRQAAHLGAHYTALFAYAVTQETWPEGFIRPDTFHDWMIEWVDSPSWELDDGVDAKNYLGLNDG